MSRFCSKCGAASQENARFCPGCGSPLTEQSTGCLSLGAQLDRRYEILSLIKSGGMGSVYKARDIRLKRVCAVKEMLGQYSNPEEQKYAIKRFEEEAYILANLTHASLPTIIDYFVEKGRYYIVMDFVQGTDLEEILKVEGDPGLREDKVVNYTIQVLEVLEYLHNQNPPIIYRDIKPSNIMIRESDNRAILVDFGIARAIQTESKTKKTVIGTPGYLAPEQWRGSPEARSDLYSLGATMHHLLTGKEPSPLDFSPIITCIETLSPDLNSIVMKALEGDLEKRYSDASEMKGALKTFLSRPTVKIQFQHQKGRCHTCRKVFPASDLILKDEQMYCIECIKSDKLAAPPEKKATGLIQIKTESRIHEKDNSEMILIPRGPFTMGSMAESDENPVHEVLLDEYYIDKYLVTNEQYEKFTDETGYVSEGNWRKYCAPRKVNYPVVGISWNDAMAYARWAGKTLPTEAEWEKAAKGQDNREYPWGNAWDQNKCNNKKMDITELIEDMIIIIARRGTVPTGSFPEGGSPYGVMDMAGNVNEWCLDWYSPSYYSVSPDRNPPGADLGSWKVLRGGSWMDDAPQTFRCCTRIGDHPSITKATIGFRCVYKASS